jgi:hypothetical protein
MTLQPLQSEFPYIQGKYYFLFYECGVVTFMQIGICGPCSQVLATFFGHIPDSVAVAKYNKI